ncbi:MAG: restriction endonuclease subunit S [Bacteroidetes bacterium]|nr:restriction endonuclease subunit S [Bacteroidota bacterium]
MCEEDRVPIGWIITTLKEVCKLKNGYAFKSKDYLKGNGIPLIRISNIGEGQVDLTDCVRVIEDPEYENYVIYNNEILVAMSGATTGKFGIYRDDKKVYQNQRVGKFEVLFREVLNNSYLLYILFSLKNRILKDAYGGAQPNISSIKIEELLFPLPPLPEQHRIVAKIEELFSSLDKGIESLKTAQAQLKVYRQAVLKWAFEGRLTNENVKEGELPEGWKWVILIDICNIKGGITKGKDYRGQQIVHLPYLRVANVQDGYLTLKEIKLIEALPSDLERYKLIYGDILYTEGGDKDKLGRGTVWKNEIHNCIHQNHIFRARPNSENFNSSFIAYYSQSKAAKNYFFKHGKQTTNLASINLTILSNLPLPICSLWEQNQIVSEIETRLSVCDKIEETIEASLLQAEALRQSLLKKAFEGKLVAQDPADEPAGVLLERIRRERESMVVRKGVVGKGKK